VKPIEKVIQLLQDLQTKVEEEGTQEATTYDKFACWCKSQSAEKATAVEDGSTAVDTNKANLDDFGTERSDANSAISKAHSDISKNSEDTKEEKGAWEKYDAQYNLEHAEMLDAQRQLGEAKKRLMAAKSVASEDSDSFAQLRKVATTLQRGKDRASIHFHSALLQTLLNQVPENDYDFHSDDVIKVIEDLEEDFTQGLSDLEGEHKSKKTEHIAALQTLADDLDSYKKSLKDNKEIRAESLKKMAAEQKDLTRNTATLQDDRAYLLEMTTTCDEKAKQYHERQTMRAEELSAITTALHVLEEEVHPNDKSRETSLLVLKKSVRHHSKAVAGSAKDAPGDYHFGGDGSDASQDDEDEPSLGERTAGSDDDDNGEATDGDNLPAGQPVAKDSPSDYSYGTDGGASEEDDMSLQQRGDAQTEKDQDDGATDGDDIQNMKDAKGKDSPGEYDFGTDGASGESDDDMSFVQIRMRSSGDGDESDDGDNADGDTPGDYDFGTDGAVSSEDDETSLSQIKGRLRGSRASEPKERVVALLRSKASELQSKALAALAEEASEDPFAKIKGLIQDLIEKMLKEAQDDAEHHGWCNTEMGKAEQKRGYEAENLHKIAQNVHKLEAVKGKLEVKTEKLADTVDELKNNLGNATANRLEEEQQNADALAEAEAGRDGVAKAITTLKRFYATAANKAKGLLQTHKGPADDMPDAGFDGAYGGSQGESVGIIGMLEAIQDDFEQAIRESEEAEKQQATDFAKFKRTTNVSLKQKELALTSATADLATTTTELADAVKELKDHQALMNSAILDLEKLKPACVAASQQETAAERQQEREEELSALKEALCIISNGGDSSDCGSE